MEIIFKDYYKILGIPNDANKETIKKAFRLKAKQTHPDISKKDSYIDFVLIREAYDILINDQTRKKYDLEWIKFNNKSIDSDFIKNNISENYDLYSNRYEDEWEYFVKNPDDYLSKFESTLRLITGSLKSIFISIFIPIIVLISIIISVIAAILLLFIFAIYNTSYSSIIGGILITILFLKKLYSLFINLLNKTSIKLAKWMNKKLKGIPKFIGKYIFYGIFTFSGIVLISYGYSIIKIFQNISTNKILILLLTGLFLIIILSISIYYIFLIFKNALIFYPDIKYTKVKAKKTNLLSSHLQIEHIK